MALFWAACLNSARTIPDRVDGEKSGTVRCNSAGHALEKTKREISHGRNDESRSSACPQDAAQDRAGAHAGTGHGDLLIKVTACGVCHSDLHAVDGDWSPPPAVPLIPGHEVAGRVVKLGAGVAGFTVGDHVGVPWMYSSCGTCEFCLAGMETICKQAEATGYTKPGGYAEYLVAPAAFVGRLPDDADPFALAPILCAGVTTYRGLKRSGARPGQWVTILGIGGLGHIAVQYAKAMGLRVAAVDVSAEKLALAKSLGAEVVVNGAETDAVAAIQEQIGGSHAAVVTAVASKAFEQAILMLRPGGTVCYIGLPGGKADEIRTSISAITNWELTVRGSNVGTRQI